MRHTLADVLPSVAVALDQPAGDRTDLLDVTPARDVVVLLIDGLGAELLRRNADVAPTLAAHLRQTIDAGFPATTATSLSSLAIGAPCATHGIIGYSFAVPGADGPENFNALRWRTGDAEGADARRSHPPEEFQQVPSAVERLAAAGIDVHYVVPGYQIRSGLTRASFRAAGELHAADSLDTVRDGILAVARHDGPTRRFAYAYFPDLDMNGHLFGPESAEWLAVLAAVDGVVADLFTDLPETCTLVITGDHGMIRAGTAVDLDADPELRRGVRLIAGEARVRHVYAAPEAAADVAARWSARLGAHAQVVTREQALDEHWFGRTPPTPVIRQRIGDVIAVAQGTSVLTCPAREPMESKLVGHHGAWTDDEQSVPLIANR
ncbi:MULTISPECIES: nucleotide pyrophosphatase/phosphodiesterase family protein [Gordonia]|uniref:alkaline phosphatase family protein n=1 Tax=Gordonia TaxID=2053 RepID=UPI0032638319